MIRFGKHGDVGDANFPKSFIVRFKKKNRLPVFGTGVAKTDYGLFGAMGVVSEFSPFATGLPDSFGIFFVSGGAA